MASSPGFRRNTANELDVLLDDLSNARYAGGQRTIETQRSEESSYSSSSFVQQLNGYHPHSAKVIDDPSSRHHKQSKSAVIRELESLMTEEETIIEETQQYKINFGSSFGKGDNDNKQHQRHQTTVYATISPPPTLYTKEQQQEEQEHQLHVQTQHTLFWHKLREAPVDMPLDMTVPIVVEKMHEDFDKSGIREGQGGQDYRSRMAEEVGGVEVEEEEETTWVMPELPEAPKRILPICAACTKFISGRCITAMMRKFHPEHFVCSYCLKQLNKGTFKEREDKPYCQECFYRLFG